MANSDDPLDRGETIPQAKRTGMGGPDPESQPGEYADEMRVNRSEPPPPPGFDEGDETQKK